MSKFVGETEMDQLTEDKIKELCRADENINRLLHLKFVEKILKQKYEDFKIDLSDKIKEGQIQCEKKINSKLWLSNSECSEFHNFIYEVRQQLNIVIRISGIIQQ